MNSSSTASVVKTLNTIVTNVIKGKEPPTIATTILYVAGSDLTATIIPNISH